MTRYSDHLIFDNSLTRENYYFSHVNCIGPSEVRHINEHLPTSTAHFYSPPNSLELTWCSRPAGEWQADIQVDYWRGRASRLEGEARLFGDTLTFWCFAETAIPAHAMPMLCLELNDNTRTPRLQLAPLHDELPAQQWTYMQIPLAAFGLGDTGECPLAKVIFSQGTPDGATHTLYVDEFKIRELSPSHPVTAPTNLTARACDRHVDLQWDAITDPEVQYVQIYRAEDGDVFKPIGIQHTLFRRFTDYIGLPHRTVYYMVTAVNHAYQESPPSALMVNATTRPFNDDELLTMVQEAHFRYYWEHAEPNSGLGLECIPGHEPMLALGASGFGLMAILVGAERGFITRHQAVEHMTKVVNFLASADRFHGIWPHFLDGRTGKVVPFFWDYDNGGDLVETSFMMQALLTIRQYFDRDTPAEQHIRETITRLWEEAEWDWYRFPDDPNFLIWHWSPTHEWFIGHPLIGWNETMITYLLAIASPTHPVPASLYYDGWASPNEQAQAYRRNWGQTQEGSLYANGTAYYGLTLPVGVGSGGPLFFTHYSFLGFDPRHKHDRFTNYYENNRAISLINYRHCVANPGGYVGYGENFWGLTASDDHSGYLAHDPSPQNDNGTMTPTGALGAFPYTPEESMRALRHYYEDWGQDIWDIYGFRDAWNPTVNYVSPIFMGLNQAPIVVMIENHRTGLLWNCFMANPEIEAMLEKIGFGREAASV